MLLSRSLLLTGFVAAIAIAASMAAAVVLNDLEPGGQGLEPAPDEVVLAPVHLDMAVEVGHPHHRPAPAGNGVGDVEAIASADVMNRGRVYRGRIIVRRCWSTARRPARVIQMGTTKMG